MIKVDDKGVILEGTTLNLALDVSQIVRAFHELLEEKDEGGSTALFGRTRQNSARIYKEGVNKVISDTALENHYSRDWYGEGTDYFYPYGWDDSGEPIIDDLAEVEEDE